MDKNFTFNTFNAFSSNGISQALNECNSTEQTPLFICIGSDLVLGDSLGPLVGTLLRKRQVSSYVYGTLNFPITAKEINYAKNHLKLMHPSSVLIAIDAAVGSPEDVGLIRVSNKGLKPGLGVDKKLGSIGEISIIGIVASKSLQNYNLYNSTRLNLIYKMAEIISDGIENYLQNYQANLIGKKVI